MLFDFHENRCELYYNKEGVISTNNIATGMIRDRHKYAFNPPKIRFNQILLDRFALPQNHMILIIPPDNVSLFFLARPTTKIPQEDVRLNWGGGAACLSRCPPRPLPPYVLHGTTADREPRPHPWSGA
jgi:hypothetical protein